AVGSGLITVSPDGNFWYPVIDESASGLPADFSLTAITYGNGRFVAVGNGGTANIILTSPDGLGWTYGNYDQDPAMGPFGNLHHVAYGNGRFVITGLDGYTLVSEDGIYWDAHPLSVFNPVTLDAISYGNGLFVATP